MSMGATRNHKFAFITMIILIIVTIANYKCLFSGANINKYVTSDALSITPIKQTGQHVFSQKGTSIFLGHQKDDGQKLMNALYKENLEERFTLVQQLLSEGADPNCPTLEHHEYVLIAAASSGSKDTQYKSYSLVKIFLDKGANPNVVDSYQRSALWWAASVGDIKSAALLLAHGAKVDAEDSEGVTPLTEAAHIGHDDVIGLLLKHGASIDKNRGAALIAASKNGSLSTVKLLLRSGANIHINDWNGHYNALLCASGMGRTKVVMYLIKHGANVNVKDEDGNTALSAAANMGFQDIVTLLKKAGVNRHLRN